MADPERSRRRHLRLAAAMAAIAVLAGACSRDPGSAPTGRGTGAATEPTSTAALAGAPGTAPLSGVLDLDLEHTAVLDGLGIRPLAGASTGRVFTTSFEDPAEIASFYATPQSAITHHEITTEHPHGGAHAHKAWVTGAGGPGLERDGPNHRGYPTIQLDEIDETHGGGFAAPTIVQFWVWLDVALAKGQWFSFATFTHDASDRWDRVVTVNLDPDGYVDIFHAPRHNENDLALQRTDVPFPMRTWVRLTAYVDLTEAHGAIAVWQGSTLIAAGRVDPRVDPAVQAVRDSLGLPPGELTDRLAQLHLGLYAPPEVAAATVFNDDITVAEIHPVPA